MRRFKIAEIARKRVADAFHFGERGVQAKPRSRLGVTVTDHDHLHIRTLAKPCEQALVHDHGVDLFELKRVALPIQKPVGKRHALAVGAHRVTVQRQKLLECREQNACGDDHKQRQERDRFCLACENRQKLREPHQQDDDRCGKRSGQQNMHKHLPRRIADLPPLRSIRRDGRCGFGRRRSRNSRSTCRFRLFRFNGACEDLRLCGGHDEGEIRLFAGHGGIYV